MRHLPNLLTLTNLFCGCCALLYTLYLDPVTAAWFTLASFVCDYADGMVARALNVSSPLGKELDSLADVVSFGVVPGAMFYQLLVGEASPILYEYGIHGARPWVSWGALPAFILSAFSGLRLARFNLDTRQTSYFIGLSTPACTVFVLGLTLTVHYNSLGVVAAFLQNSWLLYGLVILLSWLLNAEIPMFGLKVKRFDLRSNAFNLAFVGLFLLLNSLFGALSFSLIILVYIALSIIFKNKVVAA